LSPISDKDKLLPSKLSITVRVPSGDELQKVTCPVCGKWLFSAASSSLAKIEVHCRKCKKGRIFVLPIRFTAETLNMIASPSSIKYFPHTTKFKNSDWPFAESVLDFYSLVYFSSTLSWSDLVSPSLLLFIKCSS